MSRVPSPRTDGDLEEICVRLLLFKGYSKIILAEGCVNDAEIVIASETIFGQRADGERFGITIEIGRPFKWGGISQTEWACQIKVEPLRAKAVIHGEGSLQALCLALRYVHSELAAFIEKGGKIMHEDGNVFPLEAYLPPGWVF